MGIDERDESRLRGMYGLEKVCGRERLVAQSGALVDLVWVHQRWKLSGRVLANLLGVRRPRYVDELYL